MQLSPAIPHLFVTDFGRAIAYYTGPLGFRTLFTWGRPATFAHVSRGAAVLALRHVDRPALDHSVDEDLLSAFIETEGVDELFRTMQGAGAVVHQPPRDETWGMRSFIVRDPDGNLVCFAGR